LDPNVQIHQLAIETKNYTGAEIQSLVNSARSYAINRVIDFEDNGDQPIVDETKIYLTPDDFQIALREIKPKFGFDNYVTSQISKYGIMMYGRAFEAMYKNIILDLNEFINSKNQQMVLFIDGGSGSGSGRTNLALDIGMKALFPYVRYITGYSIIGMREEQKMAYIKECFDDADRSSESVIIFDDMENIIEWVRAENLGICRFSTNILIALNSLIKQKYANKKLIICTFNSNQINMIRSIGLLPEPDKKYSIPENGSMD
jgi:vesicle-fusing ATPase